MPWTRLKDAAGLGEDSTAGHTMPPYGGAPLDKFSSTCFYFGAGLIAGGMGVPIGLVHTAWGGSMIEQWLTNDAIAECYGSSIDDHNENLYDSAVKPYVNMSIKGFVYYQGENNAHGLHGNIGAGEQPASGYACMMPKLIELWRREWSRSVNTTDPTAPFGIVSLSSHDSEGAADMGSFRWAQQGSYGTLPNKAMPNTFMAHAFDLQDPWSGNTGTCEAKPLKGYDCHTPWYMGPGIHPRLKKPVGQRLALGAMAAIGHLTKGARGGVIRGCALSSSALTLMFDTDGRELTVRRYNRSNPTLSATRVLVNATEWMPVHVSAGTAPGTVVLDISTLPAKPIAVRYAWGGEEPNGKDTTCCEGDGTNAPCVPAQCPLLAMEALAPFGALPVDPFIAEITSAGKCVCPEPQQCGA